MTADPFTAATPTFLNSQRLGARPLPLAALEVAEMRRANGVLLRLFVRFAATFFVIGASCALLWKVL